MSLIYLESTKENQCNLLEEYMPCSLNISLSASPGSCFISWLPFQWGLKLAWEGGCWIQPCGPKKVEQKVELSLLDGWQSRAAGLNGCTSFGRTSISNLTVAESLKLNWIGFGFFLRGYTLSTEGPNSEIVWSVSHVKCRNFGHFCTCTIGQLYTDVCSICIHCIIDSILFLIKACHAAVGSMFSSLLFLYIFTFYMVLDLTLRESPKITRIVTALSWLIMCVLTSSGEKSITHF